jgi:hypothetical protein
MRAVCLSAGWLVLAIGKKKPPRAEAREGRWAPEGAGDQIAGQDEP